jgi:cob(I)alamin adenosyltransferase
MNQEEEEIAFSIRYVNRLSDFLFVLSRKWAMDLKADERPWLPTM